MHAYIHSYTVRFAISVGRWVQQLCSKHPVQQVDDDDEEGVTKTEEPEDAKAPRARAALSCVCGAGEACAASFGSRVMGLG